METSLAYRVNDQIGIEIIFTATAASNYADENDVVRSISYGPQGLRSLSLANFTGRLIFYEVSEKEDEVVFYETDAAPHEGKDLDLSMFSDASMVFPFTTVGDLKEEQIQQQQQQQVMGAAEGEDSSSTDSSETSAIFRPAQLLATPPRARSISPVPVTSSFDSSAGAVSNFENDERSESLMDEISELPQTVQIATNKPPQEQPPQEQTPVNSIASRGGGSIPMVSSLWQNLKGIYITNTTTNQAESKPKPLVTGTGTDIESTLPSGGGSNGLRIETVAWAKNAARGMNLFKEQSGSSGTTGKPENRRGNFLRIEDVTKAKKAARIMTRNASSRRDDKQNQTPERGVGLTRTPGFIFHKAALDAANPNQNKSNIPSRIRLQRNIVRASICRDMYQNSTHLHILCSSPEPTLEGLFECLSQDPTAIRTKDSLGRYPLHHLGDNETLIMSTRGRQTATVFGNHLINEFPAAALTPDSDGFVPFSRIIADWIDWANEKPSKRSGMVNLRDDGSHGEQSQEAGPGSRRPSMSRSADVAATRDPSLYYPGITGMFGSRTVPLNAAFINWHIGGDSSKRMFPRVGLWEEAEWCFTMISAELETLGRQHMIPVFQRWHNVNRNNTNATSNSQHNPDEEQDDRSRLILTLTKKLPNIMSTVLLVDDDGQDTRKRLFGTVLFRRLFLCSSVVGKWLVRMLNHGGIPAERAVDFLVAISTSTISDWTGGFGAPSSTDWEAFYGKREQVFDAVGNLKGTIASLVTLDTKQTSRAASTAVIWHTMNNKLSRHFVLGLVLIDLVLHVVLMVSFRSVASVDTSLSKTVDFKPAGLVYVISIHYLLRKSCEAWVLLALSKAAFMAYFSNMWTIIDLAAIILSLWATIWEYGNGSSINSGLNTLVVGLLWLKVLGFLKVVNKEMSTFIIALTQILYDIRLFMVVLTVCVFMFGDMFFITVSTKDDGRYCENLDSETESGTQNDYCKSSWASYLRTYSILLGDFELDDLKETTGTIVLFVVFTMFGVVVLLNVLIAVISDSYANAKSSGAHFFGRARVLYVAQNEALEEFLKPGIRKKPQQSQVVRLDSRTSGCFGRRAARTMLRWAVLLAVLGTALYTLVYLTNVTIALFKLNSYGLLVFVALTALVLFCALWVVSMFILDEPLQRLMPDCMGYVYRKVGQGNSAFVQWMSHKIFGLDSERGNSSIANDDSNGDDLNAKVKYLESVMEKLIIETRHEFKSEMFDLKGELRHHKSRHSRSSSA